MSSDQYLCSRLLCDYLPSGGTAVDLRALRLNFFVFRGRAVKGTWFKSRIWISLWFSAVRKMERKHSGHFLLMRSLESYVFKRNRPPLDFQIFLCSWAWRGKWVLYFRPGCSNLRYNKNFRHAGRRLNLIRGKNGLSWNKPGIEPHVLVLSHFFPSMYSMWIVLEYLSTSVGLTDGLFPVIQHSQTMS